MPWNRSGILRRPEAGLCSRMTPPRECSPETFILLSSGVEVVVGMFQRWCASAVVSGRASAHTEVSAKSPYDSAAHGVSRSTGCWRSVWECGSPISPVGNPWKLAYWPSPGDQHPWSPGDGLYARPMPRTRTAVGESVSGNARAAACHVWTRPGLTPARALGERVARAPAGVNARASARNPIAMLTFSPNYVILRAMVGLIWADAVDHDHVIARRECMTQTAVGCPGTALSVAAGRAVPFPSQRHRTRSPAQPSCR